MCKDDGYEFMSCTFDTLKYISEIVFKLFHDVYNQFDSRYWILQIDQFSEKI